MTKKPAILKEVMDCVFDHKSYNIKEVTLGDILNQGLTKDKRDFVIQKCILAEKVYELEKGLEGVVGNCRRLGF